jgi:hypothetical protein
MHRLIQQPPNTQSLEQLFGQRLAWTHHGPQGAIYSECPGFWLSRPSAVEKPNAGAQPVNR